MTDPRLAEALLYMLDEALDTPEAQNCLHTAVSIAATEPGASLLADAEVGRAVERVGKVASSIVFHRDGDEWYVTAEGWDNDPPAVPFLRGWSGTGPTLIAAIEDALGDDDV